MSMMNDYKEILVLLIPAISAVFAWYTTGVTQKKKEEREADQKEWKELYNQQAEVIRVKDKQINDLQDQIDKLKKELDEMNNKLKELSDQ